MNFEEVKDLLSKSLEVANIVDSWYEGMPFLFQVEEQLYDAFIYTSEKRDNNEFLKPQKVILVNCKTGKVSSIESKELIEKYGCETNFTYLAKDFKDVFEYFNLKKQLEKTYIKLRDAFLMNTADVKKLKSKYKMEIGNLIPFEIIEKVYKKISPFIFE